MAENAALREQLSAMERFHQDDARRIAAQAALLVETRNALERIARLIPNSLVVNDYAKSALAKLDAALEKEAAT